MRILFSYTLQTLKRNKGMSLCIMAAVLLSSTLLCALCTFGYTELKWRVEVEEYENGSWHGELGGEISPEDLAVTDNNLYVEETMVKGPFTCLKLPGENTLPYLIYRGADENYWRFMGEKNSIVEGRVPQKSGEIAVSRSFFEQNPQYRLGDTISMPEGERRVGNQALEAGQTSREGEHFHQTGECMVTLVGIMDMTTNTTVPGYYAMGCLDREALTGKEELVVYVKLKDIRRTYEVMPQIADAIGIPKDEYGKYDNHFRYHTMLLMLNYVFPPKEARPLLPALENWGVPLVYGSILLLAAGAFVMIIRGAFQISAAARMKQLGIFRSVGATPGQIGISILMEGILLSIVPILLSIGVGYLFTAGVMGVYTHIAGEMLYFPITVQFSPALALFSAGISFLTVLTAALIPAVKISKMTPLEAVHMQEESRKGKKKGRRKYKKHPLFRRLFGYTGELAAASHYAGRKGFRAGVLSLTLCLMLLCGFYSMMGLNDYLSIRNRQAAHYNIFARLTMITESDRKLPGELLSIPGQEENVYFCVSRLAYWAQPSQESEEFKSRGGFAGLDLNKWNLVKRDGKYRMRTYLYGMEEKAFDAFCQSLGESPAEYYDTEHLKALAWSAAPLYPEVINNSRKAGQSYSHLKLAPGQELMIEEKTEDDLDTDYTLSVEVGAVAAKGPEIGDVRNNYAINLYVPLKVYYAIAEGFGPEKAQSAYQVYVKMKTSPENDLAVAERAEELCRSFMPEEDFYLVSFGKEERDNATVSRAMGAVVDCIGILLGLIGISNTLSVVSRSMLSRRREFAMLRSVGMDTQEVGKLLALEGLRMAITPVLAAIPAVAGLLTLLLWILDVTWKELLPYIPWGEIAGGTALVMLAVAVSYRISSGKIRKDTIIEAVRNENLG